ncbi:MAG: hypothetical protein PCFJNLEI_00888 [Verrucomicrobiae bacterium]|nr:hypothetical protein [Verrucomicrobiae bacterium]
MIPQISSLAILRKNRRTGRVSSWDKTGRNADWWTLAPGETKVLADIRGPGQITHIWFAQPSHFREVLLRITWDDAHQPSVLCPVGDFFGLGNGIANSYQSALFTASANQNNVLGYDPATGLNRASMCGLNCYAPMPFRKRAKIELINESDAPHQKWFYIDYETFTDGWDKNLGYFHAEFRRTNPFGGWAPEIPVNTPDVDINNTGRFAWNSNYVIAETKGRGQYIGCNLSVANICGGWWGEGDDMIWVDGYKWPPDLHGTGSEDYLGHAWGMQANAHLRNGSSIFEAHTNGYQTSYVFHLENPVYFQRELKVTIEVGHGNHLGNDVSSVGYWYAARPTGVLAPPPVRQRRPVLRDQFGVWRNPPEIQCPGPRITLPKDVHPAGKTIVPTSHKPGHWTIPAGKLTKSPRLRAGPFATFQLARTGDSLAVRATVRDKHPRRGLPNFWEGTSLEVFGAIDDDNAEPGQVVFLPPVDRHAGAAHTYRHAHVVPNAAVFPWRTRRVRGGYQLTALIPFANLNLDPKAKTFRFELAVNVPQPRAATLRAAASGWPNNAWHSSRHFARVTTRKT